MSFTETYQLRTQNVAHYNEIIMRPDGYKLADVRQARLVMSDPYYGRLYNQVIRQKGHREAVANIFRAGCFDDLLNERLSDDAWFLSGPYDILRQRYQEGARNIVLVSTGSYDPMHNGHIAMMDLARQHLQRDPLINVVGGVMSSSHDAYVRTHKTKIGPDGHERVQWNQEFLENHPCNKSPWLIHDHWEARGVNVAVNFTDVLGHIQAELDQYVGAGIEVYYVFGSDVQDFAMAFAYAPRRYAHAICVERPGYPVSDSLMGAAGCLVVTGGTNDSSTALRAAAQRYLIRGDAKAATPHLADKVPNYIERLSVFRNNLHQIFSDIFAGAEVIDLDEQLEKTHQFLSTNYPHHQVISADVYLEGDSQIRSSRVFNVAGSQHHSEDITPFDVGTISSPLVFVDDDICSGFFLSQVRQHVPVTNAVSMAQVFRPGEHLDIVDERDFLIGARHGGLMMSWQGGYIRFPYMDPFVNLATRASIPFSRIRETNYRLWTANYEFYRDSGLKPADVDVEFLEALGLKDQGIEQSCEQFMRRYQ